jgi:hypothetical protein
VIRDAGVDRGFVKWMRPYARAILRDEFGKESTISVSNPAKFGEATERAKTRLNELLGAHGLTVTQIVTPRPQFNDEYEKLIEERNSLGNQLEVIKSNLAAAQTSRERKLAEVNRDQNRLIQEKRTELESALATALAEQANNTREADTYKISTIGQGQARPQRGDPAGPGAARPARGRLPGRKAEIDAFKSQPVERVMERLGERLKGVTIAIEPWASDASPSRVRGRAGRRCPVSASSASVSSSASALWSCWSRRPASSARCRSARSACAAATCRACSPRTWGPAGTSTSRRSTRSRCCRTTTCSSTTGPRRTRACRSGPATTTTCSST